MPRGSSRNVNSPPEYQPTGEGDAVLRGIADANIAEIISRATNLRELYGENVPPPNPLTKSDKDRLKRWGTSVAAPRVKALLARLSLLQLSSDYVTYMFYDSDLEVLSRKAVDINQWPLSKMMAMINLLTSPRAIACLESEGLDEQTEVFMQDVNDLIGD